MKAMKRMAAIVLAVCMLVGLPMSVSQATDTPLTLVSMVPRFSGTTDADEWYKMIFTFSEDVDIDLSKAITPQIAIRKDTGEGLYRYTWDDATGMCSEVSPVTTDTCKTSAVWELDTFYDGRGGLPSSQRMVNITDHTDFSKILKIYRNILAQDSNVRLVVNFRDKSDQPKDGYIDAITSKADSAKKLKATTTIGGDDWAEIELAHYNAITEVEAYQDNLLLHFKEGLTGNGMGAASYILGLYKDGVALENGKTWTLSASDCRLYGTGTAAAKGQKGLYIGFSAYDELKTELDANPGYEIGLKIVSAQSGVDGLITDAVSSGTYNMATNIAVDGKDAIYKSVTMTDDAKLKIVEAKIVNDTKVLVTFNKPVASTAEQWVGIRILYDGAARSYKDNGDGTYSFDVFSKGGTDGYKQGQLGWYMDLSQTVGESGNQVLINLNDTVKEFTAVINYAKTLDEKYSLIFRIQEKANQGDAYNWMVDTVWATDDPTNKLMGNAEDGCTQAIVTITEWAKVEAVNGTTTYENLLSAVGAAKSGDTVALMKDVVADTVILPAGVTLDLNGYNLDTDVFVAFGYVIDSKAGVGKLVIDKDGAKGATHLQVDNPALPLYDTDGYRFFGYDLVAKGYRVISAGQINAYGVSVVFDNVAAYELLAADADTCGVELRMDITYGDSNLEFVFKDATLETYAAACAEVMKGNVDGKEPEEYVKKTIVLTISGLNNKEISVNAILKSENTAAEAVGALDTLYSAN